MSDPPTLAALRRARTLALPDWYLAAGWIRALVWDHLTNRASGRAGVDLDLIYCDPAEATWERDAALDAALGPPWQVRNQARMHVWKGLPQHKDTADSMIYWLETVTAVGVRLELDDSLAVIAPLGVDDLVNLRCRPTAFGRTHRDEYENRIASKRWRELWPKVRFLD